MSDIAAKLDIIVPHYKEPWEVGQKFFAMLDLQRGVNFQKDFRVLLVHDGTEPFPDDYFANRPYRVEQIVADHGGVSAARNVGIKAATADWVMFCDFDDIFTHVYSLRDYTSVLPTDRYDMMWSDFIAEDVNKDGVMGLHRRGQNVVFIHGKIYRRKFILANDLWFDTDLSFNEDSFYNGQLYAIDEARIGQLKTVNIPYVWCFNPNSATTTAKNRWKAVEGLYYRNKKLCAIHKAKLPYDRYCSMVARACMDAYYNFNLEYLPDELVPLYNDFVEFFHEHKEDMWKTDIDMLRRIKNISKSEHLTGDEEEKCRFGYLATMVKPGRYSVTEWFDKVWQEGEQKYGNKHD